MAAPESSQGETREDWKHDSLKPKINTMAKHKIKWNAERLNQAAAMKTRWQKEDLTEEERTDEFKLIWLDFRNNEGIEAHLETWVYVHDRDTFLKWTQD